LMTQRNPSYLIAVTKTIQFWFNLIVLRRQLCTLFYL